LVRHNTSVPPNVRLGLALDEDPLFAELIDATRVAATELGLQVVDVRGPEDASNVDRVMIIGRPARHVGLLSAPLPVPRTVWSGEPLPAGRHGEVAGASSLERPATPRRGPGQGGRWLRRVPLGGAAARWRARVLADRLVDANLAELAWAVRQGADLVVTSHDRAAVLARHGLASRVVPVGYHETMAGALTGPEAGPRDVPLLSLGATSRHLRRGQLLERLAADRDGAPLVVADGLWGTERSAVLRRSRVLLDVHRIPGSFIGVRLVLALAAGVAVVTEPMPDARPFVPGVTHLEVPASDLLATARALAADEDRRRTIVHAGQILLAQRLRLTDSVQALIAGTAVEAPVGTT
jgi:hypothetical protein